MVPCDGAGKEVVPEAVKVLRAAGADFEFEELDINADAYLRNGVPIPDDAWKKLAAADAILFGAVGDPRVPDPNYLAGVLLRLRFELDLYVNLRPAKLYDDRLSPLRREERRHVVEEGDHDGGAAHAHQSRDERADEAERDERERKGERHRRTRYRRLE